MKELAKTKTMVDKQDINIECKDGFNLAGTIYKPETVKSAIMIAPATGIKRRFYNSFATYLAENGYGVISFDNRGIGESVNGDINKINASLVNWGKLDMTAAMESLKANFPNQKYHIVGHSAGGQLIGLMDNASDVNSFFNFASSSGSLSYMKYPFKLSASFFLNIYIPINNLFFGKTNSQWVGMGEPLPKKVAAQWSKWCNAKGYVAADFGEEIKEHYFDKLTCPSMWLHATDDGIANLENVKDMIKVYSKSNFKIKTLNPKSMHKKSIGHMGFFSSKNKDLWSYAIDFFNENKKHS
ncbi:alpha/beta hydrolase family protein [Tenacibaculum sp. M341]|uniref:alpha/beta hydrolase family protein n=1 Tax=Tenacibaculum sp. M341 TaxID=2530339 RepID=UPI001A9EFE40|nr:alpha/beta fold hydrolase [Tenacibaculum sp. M341]